MDAVVLRGSHDPADFIVTISKAGERGHRQSMLLPWRGMEEEEEEEVFEKNTRVEFDATAAADAVVVAAMVVVEVVAEVNVVTC